MTHVIYNIILTLFIIIFIKKLFTKTEIRLETAFKNWSIKVSAYVSLIEIVFSFCFLKFILTQIGPSKLGRPNRQVWTRR